MPDLRQLSAFELSSTPLCGACGGSFVGDILNFASSNGGITAVAVTRRPATSTAAPAGLLVTLDKPGVYEFSLTTVVGGVSARRFCAPTAIRGFNFGPRIESSTLANADMSVDFGRINAVAQELISGRITAATSAASVELASPGGSLGFDDRLVTSGVFNWRNYG